jgi:hypothetical protein
MANLTRQLKGTKDAAKAKAMNGEKYYCAICDNAFGKWELDETTQRNEGCCKGQSRERGKVLLCHLRLHLHHKGDLDATPQPSEACCKGGSQSGLSIISATSNLGANLEAREIITEHHTNISLL